MASDFRACRPCLPGLLCLPYRTAWSVWKPQRGCVAATEVRPRPVRVDIGGRGRRTPFFFQTTGESFMTGHFKGPIENAEF